MDYLQVRKDLDAFKPQMDVITRAKTTFEIRNFIIGMHESPSKQWHQLLIQMDEKFRALQEAEASKQLLQVDIDELEYKNKHQTSGFDQRRHIIQIQQKKNQLERLEIGMQGALKELADYLFIANSEFKEFAGKSEEELSSEGDLDYWRKRLSRQIQVDVLTFGRIQAGNLNCLLQLAPDLQKDILLLSGQKSGEYVKRLTEVEENAQTIRRISHESSPE